MFVPKTGIAYLNTNDLVDNATDGIDAVLIAAGWERSTKGEEIDGTAGATDRVYWSAGEGGRDSLYVRLTQAGNNLDIRGYAFWDPSGGTGAHEIGDAAGATRITASAAAFVGWLYASKDFLNVVLNIGGSYRIIQVGNLARTLAPQQGGKTVIANATLGAASGQPNVKVADVTNLSVGQDVWLENQSAGANMGNSERLTIQSINGTTRVITFTGNLVNDYDDGALVGQDPQPLLIWAPLNGASSAWIGGGNVNQYLLRDALAHVAAPGAQLLFKAPFIDLVAPSLNKFNPDTWGQVPVEPFVFYDTAGGQEQIRGYQNRVCRVVTVAGMLDEQTVEIGSDTYLLIGQADGSFVAVKQTA